MNTELSDLLKHTRSSLERRLFLKPCEVRNLVKRFSTFVALAEDLEDDLHLRDLQEHRNRGQAGCVVFKLPGVSLVVGRAGGKDQPA